MAQSIEAEIAELKSLFNLKSDTELARLVGIGPTSINSWRQNRKVPTSTKRLLIYMYRDMKYRKLEMLSDTKSFLDECRMILSMAQRKHGAMPNEEQLKEAAVKRFEEREEKWLKEAGKEDSEFTKARKTTVVEKLTEGAQAMLLSFLSATTENAWPPISRLTVESVKD